jgi:predicted phosphodiesterase
MTIKGLCLELLGDPHMGRKFTTGMPLHRKGDRAGMQRRDLQASLGTDAQIHICMGDLFDKPKVSNEVVAETADDYNRALSGDHTRFFCLTGNHDDSRDTDVVSSFQLFTRMVPALTVISRDVVVRTFYPEEVKLGFIPWHPIKTAAELVAEFADDLRGCDAVFGHWDVDGRQVDSDNYIPAMMLKSLGVGLAVTGHDHTQRTMVIDGLEVFVTGSMQPYAHGEDPDQNLYETRAAEDAKMCLATNPLWFADKVLRVVGEWDDEWPECLQFTVVSEATAAVEALEQVQIAEFSMASLWDESFKEIDPEISADLRVKFAELGGEDDV